TTQWSTKPAGIWGSILPGNISFAAVMRDFTDSTFPLHFHDPHDNPTGAIDHQEQQQQQQQQQQQAPSQPAAVAFTGNGLLVWPQTEVWAPTIPNVMAGHQEQMTTTTPPSAAPTLNDFDVAAMLRSTSDDSGYGGSPFELYAGSALWGPFGDPFPPPPP
ncbi:MAG: hypothetical protein LQ348_007630, partial [Seirophora lacunosa]